MTWDHIDASEPGSRLHDRVTRGEELSPEERTKLDEWYASQDGAEAKVLAASTNHDLSQLEAQVDSTLAQIAGTTQRIRELTSENEALRRELANLQPGRDSHQAHPSV